MIRKESVKEIQPSLKAAKYDVPEDATDRNIAIKLEELMESLKQNYNIQIHQVDQKYQSEPVMGQFAAQHKENHRQKLTRKMTTEEEQQELDDMEEREEIMLSACNLDPDEESLHVVHYDEEPVQGPFLYNC